MNKLRKISQSITVKKVSLDDCVIGSEVAEEIATLGFEINDLKEFLGDLIKSSNNINVSGNQLGQLAFKLHQESNASGLRYTDLVDKVMSLRMDKEENEKTILDQKKRKKNLEDELEAMLQEVKTSKEKLSEYKADKKSLKENGLVFEDIAKTSKTIKELKSLGFEANRVIEIVEKGDSLQKQIKNQSEKLDELESKNINLETQQQQNLEQIAILENKKGVLDKQCQLLKDPLNSLRLLNDRQIFDSDIIVFKDLLETVDYSFEELKSSIILLGNFKSLREEKLKEVEAAEEEITRKQKVSSNLDSEIKLLEQNKNTLFNDIEKQIKHFDSSIHMITNKAVDKIDDPEKGIKASVLRILDNSLEEAGARIARFEADSNKKIDQTIEKANETEKRIQEYEVKIEKYRIELQRYKALEDLTRLVLSEEMPRQNKLIVIVSTMELLENALNYEGLKPEADSLKALKENVFRNS